MVTLSIVIAIIIPLPFIGGIPPPGRGIVGKNRSTGSKTTVRSEMGFSPQGQEASLYFDPTIFSGELALGT